MRKEYLIINETFMVVTKDGLYIKNESEDYETKHLIPPTSIGYMEWFQACDRIIPFCIERRQNNNFGTVKMAFNWSVRISQIIDCFLTGRERSSRSNSSTAETRARSEILKLGYNSTKKIPFKPDHVGEAYGEFELFNEKEGTVLYHRTKGIAIMGQSAVNFNVVKKKTDIRSTQLSNLFKRQTLLIKELASVNADIKKLM